MEIDTLTGVPEFPPMKCWRNISVSTTLESKSFQERVLASQHKENVDNYREIGGEARNMGVNFYLVGILQGEKPSYRGFGEH